MPPVDLDGVHEAGGDRDGRGQAEPDDEQVLEHQSSSSSSSSSSVAAGPGELELDLLAVRVALVLDGQLGACGHPDALTRDRDAERLARLQRVRQAPELGHRVGLVVDLLHVAVVVGHEVPLLVAQLACEVLERGLGLGLLHAGQVDPATLEEDPRLRGDVEGGRLGRTWSRARGCGCRRGSSTARRPAPDRGRGGVNASLRAVIGPRGRTSSRVSPAGAYWSRNARCLLLNSVRGGSPPSRELRTVPGSSFFLRRAEQTKPPGIASISTPNPEPARSSAGSSSGTTGRSFTVTSSRFSVRRARAITPPALSSRSGVSKNQTCTHVRAQRVQVEGRDRGASVGVWHAHLQLDGVDLLQQVHQPLVLLDGPTRRNGGRLGHGWNCPRPAMAGHHPGGVTAHASGIVADPPRSRTSGWQSGASRARADTNFGPGAAIQSPGHVSVVGT